MVLLHSAHILSVSNVSLRPVFGELIANDNKINVFVDFDRRYKKLLNLLDITCLKTIKWPFFTVCCIGLYLLQFGDFGINTK